MAEETTATDTTDDIETGTDVALPDTDDITTIEGLN